VYLRILHGIVVGSGLILFSFRYKLLPASQLTWLSMVGFVGGIVRVYISLFGIHEVPIALTISDDVIVLSATVLDGVIT